MPHAMDMPSYAGRLFGVPLLIQQQKLDTILGVLGPKLGLDQSIVALKNQDISALYSDAAPSVSEKPYNVTDEGIAVIPIMGTLVKRSQGLRTLSGLTSYQQLENVILDAGTDNNIKGIILDIDSNGGEVSGVFDLADAIAEIRGFKPIWSVANDAMYSAAYALGCAASRVYVTRTGGVGSIGVVALHLDQSGFDAKVGHKYTYIHAGARKVSGNAHEPLGDEARQIFQAEIDRLYDIFVSTVSKNRGISEDIIRQTEARTYDGQSGIDLGLADKIGTLDMALSEMKNYLTTEQKSLSSSAQTGRFVQGTIISEKETIMPDGKATGGANTPEPIVTAEGAVFDHTAALAAATEKGHADAIAYVSEIQGLCTLAGAQDKAMAFITANKSVADVQNSLLNDKAALDEKSPISGSHLGQDVKADAPKIDTAGIYASRKQSMKGGLNNA